MNLTALVKALLFWLTNTGAVIVELTGVLHSWFVRLQFTQGLPP